MAKKKKVTGRIKKKVRKRAPAKKKRRKKKVVPLARQASGVIELPLEIAYARAEEVFERYADDLLNRPGVTGVDVGPQLKSGQPTGRFAIRVHVQKKKGKSALTSDELFERVIGGVPVDVIESRFRQAVGELQGSMRTAPQSDPGNLGTVGVAVIDHSLGDSAGGAVRLLTCAHVVAPSGSFGDGTPIVMQDAAGNVIGEALPNSGDDQNWILDEYLDCALIEPADTQQVLSGLPDNLLQPTTIVGVSYQDINGPAVVRADPEDQPTQTLGRIRSIRARMLVSSGGGGTILTRDHILIEADEDFDLFARLGDSGSIVMKGSGSVVGLLRAVDESNPRRALACRMLTVAAKLGIDLM